MEINQFSTHRLSVVKWWLTCLYPRFFIAIATKSDVYAKFYSGMKEEILKYIPLYFGSRFFYRYPWGDAVIGKIENYCSHGFLHGTGIRKDVGKPTPQDADYEIDFPNNGTFKIILANPEELSDSMKAEYYALTKKIKHINTNSFIRVDTPESLKWMLVNGVDAFNLIGSGLAVTQKVADRLFRIDI